MPRRVSTPIPAMHLCGFVTTSFPPRSSCQFQMAMRDVATAPGRSRKLAADLGWAHRGPGALCARAEVVGNHRAARTEEHHRRHAARRTIAEQPYQQTRAGAEPELERPQQ